MCKCDLCGEKIEECTKDIIVVPAQYFHQKCCNKHNDKVLKDSKRGLY